MNASFIVPPLASALLGLSAFATGGLLWAEFRGAEGAWRTLKAVSKSIAAVAFVGAGVAVIGATPGVPPGVGAALLSALVLSALGDVLLLPRGAGVSFLAGLASFLLAHVAYVIALFLAGAHPGAFVVLAVPLALMAAGVLRWLLAHVSSRMRRPVLAYVAVISTMVAAAGAHVWAERDAAALVAGGAALMFYCSDICVARERFVAPGFINKLIGLPLYFGAQWVWVLWLVVAYGSAGGTLAP